MYLIPVPRGLRWNVVDIPFDDIDVQAVRSNEFLFTTLASASFVEILAQTYSANLIKHFAQHSQITKWLGVHWQPEEIQHGQALKRYVNTVWPEFDWEAGHARFRADYIACCTVEQLEARPALELIARCVVETGTSTFYRAIHDYTDEPVLRGLIQKIKTDEAAHYTFFRRHFMLLNANDPNTALDVIATIWRRVREVRGEDAYIAFRHVYATRHPGAAFSAAPWRCYNRQVRELARLYYPYRTAIRMLLNLIPISNMMKHPVHWLFVGAAWLASVCSKPGK